MIPPVTVFLEFLSMAVNLSTYLTDSEHEAIKLIAKPRKWSVSLAIAECVRESAMFLDASAKHAGNNEPIAPDPGPRSDFKTNETAKAGSK